MEITRRDVGPVTVLALTGRLTGTDSHGTLYQHPTIRLNLELANGLAFDARGSLIRSAAYNESAFTIGIRLVGLGSEKH